MKKFIRDEQGSVLILFGLSIVFLVGIAGAGIDLGRQQLYRATLQHATDAAATSGASLDNATNVQRVEAANRYFKLNVPDDYVGVGLPTPLARVAGVGENAKMNVDSSGIVSRGMTRLWGTTGMRASAKSSVPVKGAETLDIAFYFMAMPVPYARTSYGAYVKYRKWPHILSNEKSKSNYVEGDPSHLFRSMIKKFIPAGTTNRVKILAGGDGARDHGGWYNRACERTQTCFKVGGGDYLHELPWTADQNLVDRFLWPNNDEVMSNNTATIYYRSVLKQMTNGAFRKNARRVLVIVGPGFADNGVGWSNTVQTGTTEANCAELKARNIIVYYVELPHPKCMDNCDNGEDVWNVEFTDPLSVQGTRIRQCPTYSTDGTKYYKQVQIQENAPGDQIPLHFTWRENQVGNWDVVKTNHWHEKTNNYISTTSIDNMADDIVADLKKIHVRIIK